jgi:hypothetical protein
MYRYVDLSEKILQVKDSVAFRFGDEGFGFYDGGDGKLKVFNWNMEITRAIPVQIGEGPGEIKPFIFNACMTKDTFILNGYLEKRINIYDKKGKFTKSFFIDFSPRKIIYREDRLYAFNSTFFDRKENTVLVKTIDPSTGEPIKTICLKDKIDLFKKYKSYSDVSQRLFDFEVKGDNFLILDKAGSRILEYNEDGKLVKKISLPYEFRMDMTEQVSGENRFVVLSMLDMYTNFIVVRDHIYACFMKSLKYDKEKRAWIIKTLVIKLKENGKHTERVFDGDLVIFGVYKDSLYLFDFNDYKITICRFSDWD